MWPSSPLLPGRKRPAENLYAFSSIEAVSRPYSAVSPCVSTSSESYGALVERLRDLDGNVFTVREAQSIRDAADARLFGDADQIETVTAALEMMDTLVEAAPALEPDEPRLGDLLCSIEPAAGVES